MKGQLYKDKNGHMSSSLLGVIIAAPDRKDNKTAEAYRNSARKWKDFFKYAQQRFYFNATWFLDSIDVLYEIYSASNIDYWVFAKDGIRNSAVGGFIDCRVRDSFDEASPNCVYGLDIAIMAIRFHFRRVNDNEMRTISVYRPVSKNVYTLECLDSLGNSMRTIEEFLDSDNGLHLDGLKINFKSAMVRSAAARSNDGTRIIPAGTRIEILLNNCPCLCSEAENKHRYESLSGLFADIFVPSTLGDELVGANNGLVSGEGALAHDVCINDLNSFLYNAVYTGKHLGVMKDICVRQIVGIHIKTKGDDDNV